MKNIAMTSLIVLSMAAAGCRRPAQETRTQMLLDSEASGANVAVARPGGTARPAEPIPDFKALRNIMQSDIDAGERIPSKEVVYVKQGEPARPSETKR